MKPVKLKELEWAFYLRHGSIFGLKPREDKAVFLLQPCILILKVAKNFRETFFQGVELIKVEVM